MKGEISFVEYIVSTGVFITFVAYIFFNLLALMPAYFRQIENERKISEAYQISELLINDPGEPINWHQAGQIKRLGLSDETRNKTNLLSESKINAIGSSCNLHYENVKKMVGSDYNFSLILIQKYPTQSLKIYCAPSPIIIGPTNITVKRFVTFGSKYGELIVQMW